MSLNQVDLAVSASWIIPVVPTGRTLENSALIINQGKIIDIVLQSELAKRYHVNELVELEQHVLIPGLVNAHGHAAMSLLRGYADDLQLQPWLEQHIWPAEARLLSEAFVRDGTELAIAEMLLSGTSCFSDMYFFPEVAAEVARESGIRAQLAFPILDFATAWASGPEEAIHKGLSLHDRYRSSDRIGVAFGPHAPYTVGDESLRKVVTLAEELQIPLQIHLHETADEVEQALKHSGMRPSQRLAELGLLSPLSQCVHMTQVDDGDITLLQNSGAHVIHCPNSNMKLASGACPVTRLLDAGVNVALGTDGAASNNGLNMLSEMRQAALLAKVESGNASAVHAHQALYMATMAGAKALGLDKVCGSLELGKAADICAIDLSGLAQQPMYNPVSQIVYSHCRASDVWVAGQRLLENGVLTRINQEQLVNTAQQWREKVVNV
ncbi:TRZ/ATZ family hydrolase [Agaribacterium haliotis]|uniref:TRZ/ATZ family hydrolase n=1 Tax=Agaribacterium haliotis TaxID=2013869 RepID=UPI000BB54E61|nr:TRZ/ATZ family hydrolase [Agaribacterium haliotis]